MGKIILFLFCVGFIISCRPHSRQQSKVADLPIRLNHIQVIGSHNSYKQAIEPALFKLLMAIDSSRFLALDYAHIPLQAQLDLGLRKLELDVVYDPQGGRYAQPLGLQL